MKLSDFLFNIGRPVAFYPGLVKALGSMKQAVFICQMAFWKDKGSDPDGWIYKTSEDIEEETSLTYKEQIRVRAALVEIKALEERYARTEHQMYFRVNWDIVNNLWDKYMTNGHMPKSNVVYGQRGDGTLPLGISLNSNTYSTPENTPPRAEVQKKSVVTKSDMPEWSFVHGEELTPSQIAEIEENSSRKWKYRESFPSELLPLADLVVSKFGPPIKARNNNQVALYLSTIGSWHDVGCTISDWPRALEIVKAYSNPIVRITGMTDPLKLAMQERKNRKAPEERRSIPEKQGISRDEALSRGLITHPKIGASS